MVDDRTDETASADQALAPDAGRRHDPEARAAERPTAHEELARTGESADGSADGSAREAEAVMWAQSLTAPAVPAEVSAEHERLVAERQSRREARVAALAPQPVPDPMVAHQQQASAPVAAPIAAPAPPQVITETVTQVQRTTDKFAGSLGLFLLRVVVAGVIGYRGVQKLLDLPGTTDLVATTILPAPEVWAIVVGAAEVLAAIALLFGALTRLAGLGVALVAGGALAFVLWGPWTVFTPGQPGFLGELELLLVAVGVMFLFVGAGGWSVDHGIAARRAVERAER